MLVAVVLAVVAGVAGTAIAYDARLDLADDNLENAGALLQVADELPLLDEQAERQYSKELGRAIKNIESARINVANAIEIADVP